MDSRALRFTRGIRTGRSPSPGAPGPRAPERPLLLTFFSVREKAVPADAADHVDYLPFDTLRNMRRFDAILPVADTVLAKYELWPRLIEVRLARGARLHPPCGCPIRSRTPSGWARAGGSDSDAQLTHLLVQDPGSAETLGTVGLRADVLGDPRVDRVLSTVQTPPNGAIGTASTDKVPLDGRPQPARGGAAHRRAIGRRSGTSSPPCRDRDGASSSRPTARAPC